MTAPLVLRFFQPDPAVIVAGCDRDALARAHVAGTSFLVLIGPPGPIGPAGPEAPPYEHVQASASAIWTVNHNRGARPLVQVLTPGGAEVEAEILHVSDNQFQVKFSQPFAGTAIAR